MQLELAFLERPTAPAARMKGPWDQIDPQAQIVALDILSRLMSEQIPRCMPVELTRRWRELAERRRAHLIELYDAMSQVVAEPRAQVRVCGDDWPETVEDDGTAFLGEPYLGPLE